MSFIKRFLKDESGATAVEYGIMAAVIGLGVAGAATTLKRAVANQYGAVGESLKAAR